MKFSLQNLSNSRFAVNFTLWLGRTFPRKVSYQVGNFFAKIYSKRKNSAMVRSVRANQWVIRGEQSSSEELDQAVLDVFQHAGRCFADLYHAMHSPEKILSMFTPTDACLALIARSQKNENGAFLAAPHISNFDLALLALAYRGLQAQVLTYGQPTGGYEIQNDLRAATGMDIIPAREETHRNAIEHMRNGGMVITAVDRPIRHKAHTLTFFGHPSPLPTGHIRMALAAEVPVIPVAAQMSSDGRYHIEVGEPITMIPNDNPDEAIRINGEAVLKALEQLICVNPEQWLMYYPVWPTLMADREI
ncbi:MAG: lysophospholipid acyltransferase family protein [Chloroflexi bacterium]|nr:lysophospholipid acyltransferase family protein [Chloroflexota bacterium]